MESLQYLGIACIRRTVERNVKCYYVFFIFLKVFVCSLVFSLSDQLELTEATLHTKIQINLIAQVASMDQLNVQLESLLAATQCIDFSMSLKQGKKK